MFERCDCTCDCPSTFAAAVTPSLTEHAESVRSTVTPYEYRAVEDEALNPELSNPTRYVTPLGLLEPTCTLRNEIEPTVPDSTSTIYRSTVTSTTYTDCSNCVLEWSTGALYFFAPIFNTATTTQMEPSTSWEFDCQAKETHH